MRLREQADHAVGALAAGRRPGRLERLSSYDSHRSDGAAAGLDLVDSLAASGDLAGYHLLPATRADLLRRLGRLDEAAQRYREALALAVNDAERRYLNRRLAEAEHPT